MTEEKKIVEVKVLTDAGEEVPIGLMNTRQAMKLPEELDVTVSHPEDKAGATERFIDREELKAISGSAGARQFPSPSTDVEADRFKQARKVFGKHWMDLSIPRTEPAGAGKKSSSRSWKPVRSSWSRARSSPIRRKIPPSPTRRGRGQCSATAPSVSAPVG